MEPLALDGIVARVSELRKQRNRAVLVAIDGRSGVGKSTLARRLAPKLGAQVVFGDDFYAGGTDEEWAARSPRDRYDRVFDWRRLRADALEPLLRGDVARWRPFDWRTWQGLAEEVLTRDPAPVVVLDMVYSGRPELADLVDLAILVALDDEERRARLVAREGTAYMERWWALWDSAEEYYFGQVRPAASFDLMLRDVRPQTTAAAFGAPRDRDPSEGKSVPGPRLG